jgi:hypothetical protein
VNVAIPFTVPAPTVPAEIYCAHSAMRVVLDAPPTSHWFGLPATAKSGPYLTGEPPLFNMRSFTPVAVEPLASVRSLVVLPGLVASVKVT